MPTTTIRLSDELKEARWPDLADATAATSPHNYPLRPSRRRSNGTLRGSASRHSGRERAEQFDRTGLSVPLEEVRRYQDLARGRKAARPVARKSRTPA